MICAVVLAAGLSRRMGPGVQKLLLPFAGSTVIGHVVGQVLAARVERAIVVTGRDARVAAAASASAGRGVTVVVNEAVDDDMLGSARCGLRALPAGCDAVLLVPGDQPSITTGFVLQVIRAYAACGRRIVVPTYKGRRGHPLLFAAGYAPEVLSGYDGVGVRGLLRSHPDDVFELDVADPGVVNDIDLPDDYERELARLARPVRTSDAPPGRE
jgi:molybdenum cofactor cytidylyltransferase